MRFFVVVAALPQKKSRILSNLVFTHIANVSSRQVMVKRSTAGRHGKVA
jgi:hypothetical protein